MSDPININKTSVRFVADGEITDFHFNFTIFSIDDIEIYLDSTLQSEGFTINKSTNSEGGNIVFNTAPSKNSIVTISRNLEVKRTTNFSESKAFRAKMLNHEFDYQVAYLEQITETLKRNINIPVYSDTTIQTTLPLPKPGKAILWNANGTALINSQINVEELDNSTAECLKAAEEASQAANSAVIAAAEANHATYGKANLDLSNVSENDAKSKSGTRFYDSGNINIVTSTLTTINHNLPLETEEDCHKCIVRVDLVCTTASNNYSAGDTVSAWGLTGSTGYVDVPVGIKSITLSPTQWSLIVSNGIYILNKTTGAYNKITPANYKLRVKIWY